jgi:hypothetical protein
MSVERTRQYRPIAQHREKVGEEALLVLKSFWARFPETTNLAIDWETRKLSFECLPIPEFPDMPQRRVTIQLAITVTGVETFDRE